MRSSTLMSADRPSLTSVIAELGAWKELARVYGQQFTEPTYIATMALVSRLRLDERDEVARLMAPYLSGAKDSFGRPSQSSLASRK